MDRAIVWTSFVVAVVLSVAAFAFFGKLAAVSVVVGELIAAVNFRLASGMLRKILVQGENPSGGRWKGIFFFLIRYVLLGAMLTGSIWAGISPVFLILGLSALLIGVLASALKLVGSAGEA